MSEEIKEILEDVKRHLDYVNATGLKSIRDNEMKAMYDYITNLQEENTKLKELCNKYEEEHKTTFEYWKHLIKEDYKTRIDKAIEYTNQFINFKTSRIDEWENVELVLETIVSLLKGDNK